MSSPFFPDADRALAEAVAQGRDEVEAAREYIHRERPHLLTCYDIESLVGMVLDARAGRREAPAPIEAYFTA